MDTKIIKKKTESIDGAVKGPIKLKTWNEYREYLAQHLTPSSYGPKGQPIYRAEEIAKLDIQYPDDQD